MGRYYYKIVFTVRQEEATLAEFDALLQQHISSSLLTRPVFKETMKQAHSDILSAEWLIHNNSLQPCAQTSKLMAELSTLAMHLERNSVCAQMLIQPQHI